MMSPHNLIRRYFECLSEMGEEMSFDLIKRKNGKEEILTYNHLSYDGASALCEHLQSLPGKHILPEVKSSSPPPGWERFWHLNRWWYTHAYRSFYRPMGKATGGYLYDSRTLIIKDESNLNARLLKGLHQALRPDQRTLWMLPVSMHEKLTIGMEPSNCVSFIDITVANEDSVEVVRQKITTELKRGSHWGTIYSMLITYVLGNHLFKKVFPYLDLFLKRTGTFTNLGKWEVAGLSEDEAWGIKATVVPLNPLGASALQVNDKLTIGLQLHPTLGLSADDLRDILDRWMTAVQNQ